MKAKKYQSAAYGTTGIGLASVLLFVPTICYSLGIQLTTCVVLMFWAMSLSLGLGSLAMLGIIARRRRRSRGDSRGWIWAELGEGDRGRLAVSCGANSAANSRS